jgi:hypothetical protein
MSNIWYNEVPTEQDYNDVNEFLDIFDITMRFESQGFCSVNCETATITICVNSIHTLRKLWSMVFHEMCHIQCHRDGLYDKYHKAVGFTTRKQYKQYVRRYGLRAERFVDKKAKKMQSIYLPDIPYVSGYDEPDAEEWYRNWVENNI